MPLTNAEKQKRWRDRRNQLAKQAEELLRNQKIGQANGPDGQTLAEELEPHLHSLWEQSIVHVAMSSPGLIELGVVNIENILIRRGLIPPNERVTWEGRAKYRRRLKRAENARSMKAKADPEWRPGQRAEERNAFLKAVKADVDAHPEEVT
jgi:hypothetical protein